MRGLGFSTLVLILGCCSLAAEKPPVNHYVDLKCMSHYDIVDFGICKQTGDSFDCPNTHTKFTMECTSLKPDGSPTSMKIIRPMKVLVEE